jgi:iron complex transport system ATP-binding protein
VIDPVLSLSRVRVEVDGRALLDEIDWDVRPGERWVVLGPNGGGKTTLVRVASMYLHPSSGDVRVLGERLGTTDVRALRTRIGLVSPALADLLRPGLAAVDVVVTAPNAALETWWHRYDEHDRALARRQLDRLGVGALADRTFGTLSSGERQRVLLARVLRTNPGLVLLDEPTAGLDLPGREAFVGALASLAADPAAPPMVLVTHHVEEIPPGFTHALLLRGGRVLAAGPLDEVLTAPSLSACFGLPLVLERHDGRFTARATGRA